MTFTPTFTNSLVVKRGLRRRLEGHERVAVDDLDGRRGIDVREPRFERASVTEADVDDAVAVRFGGPDRRGEIKETNVLFAEDLDEADRLACADVEFLLVDDRPDLLRAHGPAVDRHAQLARPVLENVARPLPGTHSLFGRRAPAALAAGAVVVTIVTAAALATRLRAERIDGEAFGEPRQV